MTDYNMVKLKDSKDEYESLHKDTGFSEEEEYYKVIASFLKGNKSVDIGCGYGFVERFSIETVGADFSSEALRIARKNGATKLVVSAAENLPFKDNVFDVSLNLGVLEHCSDQAKAVKEMVRVSEIQILVVHAKLPFFLEYIRPLVLKLFGLKDQPIEKPLSKEEIKKMLESGRSRIIIEGIWNYIDLRWLWKKIPYGAIKFPSHHFIVSIKTDNKERRFLGIDAIKSKNER